MDDKNINLIIIDDSFDTEELVVSTLRTLGYAARSTRAEDDEDLIESIKTRAPDLVIYTLGMELISLAQTCTILRNSLKDTPVPVIAVTKNDDTADVSKNIEEGARDLSSYKNIKHLSQVIKREITAYRNLRKTHQLEQALEESERRCSSLIDSSRDAIAYIHEGMHVYANTSYLESFDIELSDDLEGIPILDMVAADSRDVFKSFLREYMNKNTSDGKLETTLRKPDGTEFKGEMEFSAARIDDEPCIQIIIRKDDVNSEELERQLKLMSQRDQLTGLYNRQHSLEELESIIQQCEVSEATAAIMVLRLDNIDNIKSEVGIVGTDQFIAAVAGQLKQFVSEDDILSRYTYSCFSLVTRDHNKSSIEKLAKKLQDIISDFEASISDININTTCCVGITLIDKTSPECNEVLARAESASNQAREIGNNQISIYVPKEGELTRKEVETKFRGQLTDAMANNRFILYYQPIVSLHGDQDERYEVFVRMKNEDGELIMPHDFFPAAERIGMATAIDRWVLTQTMSVLKERWASGKQTRFFIKLSAPSLKDETLIDWLDYQIKEKQLPSDCLVFEVKETAAVTNLKYTKTLCEKLKKIHCGFVLDDFGTGANPLQLLEHINADYVRLDKSFMEDLSDNTQHQEIIKKITEQVAEKGKLSIAQFVPDASSLSILWGMSINFIQGHFLQAPSTELNYDFTEMSG